MNLVFGVAVLSVIAPMALSSRCISSCKGVSDGDYQSCLGCNVYVTCSNGITYDNRPCAEADLVWDDNLKRCEYTSNTCPGTPETNCIRSCNGLDDGDYQSCVGCTVYATCSNGNIYDNRPCPANLVWDDDVKRCEWKSATCKVSASAIKPDDSEQQLATEAIQTVVEESALNNPNTVPRGCISSCKGVSDGDYQSCLGCNVYVTCSNGITYDNRPCAEADLVWDDNLKRCEYTSNTCPGTPETNCIRSCNGLDDGDYQSCVGCNVYATCSNGNIYDNRPCPATLVWDDDVKRCEWKSNTCKVSASAIKPDDREQQPSKEAITTVLEQSTLNNLNTVQRGCISSCKGVSDGDYQSCLGCNVYVTCSNGITYDNRPCAEADLVWDDNLKRCEYTSNTCPGTPETNCIRSCNGLDDGDYQSCVGCNVYATCSNGDIYDNRPCPANLVWDDNVKRCEWKSNTCKVSASAIKTDDREQQPAKEAITTVLEESALNNLNIVQRGCISSCTGVSDGDYQSCLGCNVYVTCSNGITYDNRPCAEADLVWDDNLKRCEYTSNTCPGTPETNCIRSCNGLDDGDYQSCVGCNVYATCSNGDIYDNRPCPANLVWDDNVKRCEWKSNTCKAASAIIKEAQSVVQQPATDNETTDSEESALKKLLTGLANVQRAQTKCVKSCNGLANGDYQSCSGCTVYATCSNEFLSDNRPCPAGLVWDDNKKRCEWVSETCGTSQGGNCIRSCNGLDDGDYQSCVGCNVYATCSNGNIYDNRPCPANLVWDDNVKRCEWKSANCKSTAPSSCATSISCSSWKFQDAECSVPGKQLLSAALVKQVSSSTCTLGESYGVKNNKLWVKDGCRGDFTVCACSKIAKIDCDSWGFNYADCPINGANAVLGVKLVHQESGSKCELGASFGIDGGSIWVDKGCRGAFDVCV